MQGPNSYIGVINEVLTFWEITYTFTKVLCRI
jgi:hypothetical protein